VVAVLVTLKPDSMLNVEIRKYTVVRLIQVAIIQNETIKLQSHTMKSMKALQRSENELVCFVE